MDPRIMKHSPAFHVTFSGEDQGIYSLAELLECNLEGAPELCEWMRTANIGDEHREGGGASPLVITRRVS